MATIAARRSPLRILICTIGLVAVSACVETQAPRPAAPIMPSGKSDGPPQAASPAATPIDVDGELARLRAALMREAPGAIIDNAENERAWIARTLDAFAAESQTIDRPQLFVVAQRKAGGQGKKARSDCSCMRPIRTISRSGLAIPRQRAASAFLRPWTDFSIAMEYWTRTTSEPRRTIRGSTLCCSANGHRHRSPGIRSSS